jgi:hypothetical protein
MATATLQALHVGQVLQGSWGYDMTINQFFVIQRLTASSVWLREVAAVVSNDNGMGSGTASSRPVFKASWPSDSPQGQGRRQLRPLCDP